MLLVNEEISDQDTLPERRRGLRIRQARPVKIFEPAASRYFGGQTHDLSATGLRIELPLSTPVRLGRIVSVHIGSDQGGALANHRQMLPARVVWIDRDQDRESGRLVAGIQFLSSIAAAASVA